MYATKSQQGEIEQGSEVITIMSEVGLGFTLVGAALGCYLIDTPASYSTPIATLPLNIPIVMLVGGLIMNALCLRMAENATMPRFVQITSFIGLLIVLSVVLLIAAMVFLLILLSPLNDA